MLAGYTLSKPHNGRCIMSSNFVKHAAPTGSFLRRRRNKRQFGREHDCNFCASASPACCWWRRNAIQKAHRRSPINNLANRQQTTQTRSVSSGAVGRAGGKQRWWKKPLFPPCVCVNAKERERVPRGLYKILPRLVQVSTKKKKDVDTPFYFKGAALRAGHKKINKSSSRTGAHSELCDRRRNKGCLSPYQVAQIRPRPLVRYRHPAARHANPLLSAKKCHAPRASIILHIRATLASLFMI